MIEIRPNYDDPRDIIPQIGPPKGKDAEAELYALLREQLPDNWFVIYNPDFIDGVQENQIDFLVLVPEMGIVNLECKGHGFEPVSISDFRSTVDSKTIIHPLIQSKDAVKNFYGMVS